MFKVTNCLTHEVVATCKTMKAARANAERRNQAHGCIRFIVRG